jgi:glycosyltransferase involved in cell wall biosynthesis
LFAKKINFTLHIIGDGPLLPTLRKELAIYPPERIVIHGQVPLSRVQELMAAMHILISVSEFEGTSISMLEAMGQGVVPVVTDIASGVRDVIEPQTTGWVVPVGDMPAMANVLAMLDADRNLLSAAGAAAWARIHRDYSFRASAGAMSQLLHRVANSPRGPYRMRKNHPVWRTGLLERPWLPNSLVRGLRLAKTAMQQRLFPGAKPS